MELLLNTTWQECCRPEWVSHSQKMWGVNREPAAEGRKIMETWQSSARVRIKWKLLKSQAKFAALYFRMLNGIGHEIPSLIAKWYFSTSRKLKATMYDWRVTNTVLRFKTAVRADRLTGPSPSDEFYASIYKKSYMKKWTCSYMECAVRWVYQAYHARINFLIFHFKGFLYYYSEET